MTTSTTRIALKADLLRLIAQFELSREGGDAEVGRLPVPLATTSTAADALGVLSTRLGVGTGDAERFDGRIIQIAETVASGPTIGEIAGVDDSGFDSVSDLTTSPAFSAAVQSGTDLHVYPRGWAPEMSDAALDRVLRATEAPHLWFPSLVDDSDFDANDLTNWDAVNTPGTREFVTTAANAIFGPRALHLATADDGEGAESEDIEVDENEQLLVIVYGQVVAGSIEVVLRRVTATAADLQAVTLTDLSFETAWMQETPTAGTKAVAVRLLAAENSSEFYISAPVIVQSDRRRYYTAPSWLLSDAQIVSAGYLPFGDTAVDDDAYIPLSGSLEGLTELNFLRADRDLNPFRVGFRSLTGYGPVCLKVKRAFDALSSDASTTICDREYLVHQAMGHLLADRGEANAELHYRRARDRARSAGYGGVGLRMSAPRRRMR